MGIPTAGETAEFFPEARILESRFSLEPNGWSSNTAGLRITPDWQYIILQAMKLDFVARP